MTPTLRKRHFQIWLTLAVIMPILFVLAVLVIPQPVYQDTLYQDTETVQPAVNKEPKDNAQ